MDRFRVYALEKILKQGGLHPRQRALVLEALIEKCSILGTGYSNRGKIKEARIYEQAVQHYQQALEKNREPLPPLEKEMLLYALED